MDELTFIILKTVVSVCAALITVYLVPYIKTLRNDSRYAQVAEVVDVAVRAAEQTIKGIGQGANKKEVVLTFVNRWMDEHGIYMESDQLNQLIECAVWQIKQGR